MGVAVALELLVEEVDIEEEVRDRVLIHQGDIPAREEVLWAGGGGRSEVVYGNRNEFPTMLAERP